MLAGIIYKWYEAWYELYEWNISENYLAIDLYWKY